MSKKTFWVGLLITTAVPLLEALVRLSPENLNDWQTWLVGIGTASVRQGAAYVLGKVIK